MSSLDSRRILVAAASLCLLAALAGCRCHRAGRGFIARGPWALECDNVPRLSYNHDRDEEPSVARSSPEPERLRWRIRRKGYQLASRLFGRGGVETGQNAAVDLPEPAADVLEGRPAEARLASAEESAEEHVPDAHLYQLESWRPDLAVD